MPNPKIHVEEVSYPDS